MTSRNATPRDVHGSHVGDGVESGLGAERAKSKKTLLQLKHQSLILVEYNCRLDSNAKNLNSSEF